MPRSQHDRKREREQNQQDYQRQSDAEATTRLGRVDRGQRRRTVRLGLALMASEHIAFVERERASDGTQVAAHEDVTGQRVELILFELADDAERNARGLGDLREGDLPELTFLFQIAAE